MSDVAMAEGMSPVIEPSHLYRPWGPDGMVGWLPVGKGGMVGDRGATS